jgi:O-antigen/teichoic acid export membrane protein
MTRPAFYPAADLVPVVLIAYVFQSWTIMQDVGIHLRERTEYITIANWVAAGVAFLGYVLLIPRWLGLGAAIATVLSFGVRYLIILRLSLRLLPVRYNWSPVRRILAFAVVSAVASLAVVHDSGMTPFAIRVLCFAGYLAALWFGGVLTAAERETAKSFVARQRRRLRLRRAEQQPLRPLAEGETL